LDESINEAMHEAGNEAGLPAGEANGQPRHTSTLHHIFMGRDGLRAGWRLLIFIAILAALLVAANALGHKLHLLPPRPAKGAPERPFTPTFTIIVELIPFLLTVLATWIMSRIERRSNSVYGLGGPHKLSLFLKGLVWGVVCLSLLVTILWKAGFLAIDERLLFGSAVLHYGLLWLLAFFLVGLLEEYLTRGYLLYTLTRGLAGIYRFAFNTRHSAAMGFWTAAILLSIVFGLGHGSNPGESPIGLLSAGLASLVFCLSLWRTGSLWWAIGFHASWDWAQSFLYGVADSGTLAAPRLLSTHPVGKPLLSGGTTGPEGSVFVLLILALIVVLILLTLPRSVYGTSTPPLEVSDERS
jgi:membrane protease YdiL (CAAX protease family)